MNGCDSFIKVINYFAKIIGDTVKIEFENANFTFYNKIYNSEL